VEEDGGGTQLCAEKLFPEKKAFLFRYEGKEAGYIRPVEKKKGRRGKPNKLRVPNYSQERGSIYSVRKEDQSIRMGEERRRTTTLAAPASALDGERSPTYHLKKIGTPSRKTRKTRRDPTPAARPAVYLIEEKESTTPSCAWGGREKRSLAAVLSDAFFSPFGRKRCYQAPFRWGKGEGKGGNSSRKPIRSVGHRKRFLSSESGIYPIKRKGEGEKKGCGPTSRKRIRCS